ncbi:ATP-binding protein [Actinomadura soli]|uniref:ATP-binding protein n=1 Tax=Actinomadura soli TaxID=2508997 RepID=A0A5C4JGS3_9ACTN|nr:ATP-binding protein [Actinomadura soli]TMR04178.1 ATP-binding protein [Actinomadura soli]
MSGASELVTNALRHASQENGDITLRLGRTEDRTLWLEVQDGTPKHPHLQPVDMISEVGCSLVIVDYLSRGCGLHPLEGDTGKVVFAVIDPCPRDR